MCTLSSRHEEGFPVKPGGGFRHADSGSNLYRALDLVRQTRRILITVQFFEGEEQ